MIFVIPYLFYFLYTTESVAPVHLIEDWRINRTSLRRFGVDSCKEFTVILSLTAYKSFSRAGLSSNNDTGVNQCVFRVLRRWRGEREGGSGSSQRSLIFCWFIDFQASISLSLFSRPLSLCCTPSQIQMSLVPAERLRASTRLIFLPRLLIPQLCSVFKMLRFLLGASNKEYTVTGEEKEEKERTGVTRYQWNQIYLTCPRATFIFQVDWTDYVECSGSEM